MDSVLITGGNGLIGAALTELLLSRGYTVTILSRSGKSSNPSVKVFKWDIDAGYIDPGCIENVGAIIHLAGEGIADEPWTKARKQSLIKSRTGSLRLIYSLLEQNQKHQVKTLISSSAVGYYGDRGDEILEEEAEAGEDFLSLVCREWENIADEGLKYIPRIVKLRTGVVLDKVRGALPQMAKPIKAGFGAPLGSGKQWAPWIHIKDVAALYAFCLQHEHLQGGFNATAPNPVTNEELTKILAARLHKRLLPVNVPGFALRIILGEMSRVVLNSNRASAGKIIEAGFTFSFDTIERALENIYD